MSKEGEKKTAQTPGAPKQESKKQARIVHKIIERVEERLTQNVEKATLGDYIKLVQLEKELEAEMPREIRVTWVEPTAETPAESENDE